MFDRRQSVLLVGRLYQRRWIVVVADPPDLAGLAAVPIRAGAFARSLGPALRQAPLVFAGSDAACLVDRHGGTFASRPARC